MYRYNLLGSIIKYTMGSIVFINGNYFICVMPVIVIMIPKIIQVIAILSLRDLMIPAIPIPNMSTPTTIGNFILKFNNKNKLLSQNIYQSVYSNMIGGHSASIDASAPRI